MEGRKTKRQSKQAQQQQLCDVNERDTPQEKKWNYIDQKKHHSILNASYTGLSHWQQSILWAKKVKRKPNPRQTWVKITRLSLRRQCGRHMA
eukprot:m.173797 g.173797  ORF g.173797 m.173797 type:complete len:92 (-) comp16533_c15_seq8:1137-1412(-)